MPLANWMRALPAGSAGAVSLRSGFASLSPQIPFTALFVPSFIRLFPALLRFYLVAMIMLDVVYYEKPRLAACCLKCGEKSDFRAFSKMEAGTAGSGVLFEICGEVRLLCL